MKFKMVHENYNVANLETSMAFYEKALGLHEVSRKNGDGFILVYMGNDESPFELELTWLEEHPQAYDLGECEFHLAFKTDDYEAAHKYSSQKYDWEKAIFSFNETDNIDCFIHCKCFLLPS